MKITKLGHCSLLIEEKNLWILTDPGSYTTAQNKLKNIDVVLITHEHPDHIHMDSLKLVLKNNPTVKIFTNGAVAKLLEVEKISFQLLNDKESIEIEAVLIEALEEQHAIIYPGLPRVLNTGFIIANKLFYPGDALIQPNQSVEVLACPVAGPWIKLAEAIDYAKAIKPNKIFPVHDGGLSSSGTGATYRISSSVLEQEGIEVIIPDNEKSFEV